MFFSNTFRGSNAIRLFDSLPYIFLPQVKWSMIRIASRDRNVEVSSFSPKIKKNCQY